MFNQGTYIVFTEFIAERFRIIATIISKAPQVASITPSDLRADLCIRFLARGGVDVGDVQRLDIHEVSDF